MDAQALDAQSPTEAPPAEAQAAPEQFSADYVKKLRQKLARYRIRNRELKQRLEAMTNPNDKPVHEGAPTPPAPTSAGTTPGEMPPLPDEVKNVIAQLYEQVQTLQSELKQRELQTLRLTIADEIGLPRTLIDRLRGEDAETIRQDAQALLEAVRPLTSATPRSTSGALPWGAPSGATPTPVPGGQRVAKTPEEIYREMVYGQANPNAPVSIRQYGSLESGHMIFTTE